MRWDEQLNKAIDYIEENLNNQIDMDKIAKIMCQPKSSFQRSFSLIMNITINEYIRKRRMTLAVVRLQNSNEKIVDIAILAGYDSPEAFARAFKEIHRVTPSEARNKNVRLNIFPRITCLLTVRGEIQMEMDYKIASVDGCEINWKGVDWEAFPPPPSYGVIDKWINTANQWREAGYRKVLEVGARLGHSAIYLAQQGFDVTAIDISGYAIQYLKDWAKREKLGIHAEVGDMHDIPFPDKSFDCLFAHHAISHTNYLGVKKTIAEIERVLKPAGSVYLSFSSKDSTEFVEKQWQQMDGHTLICPHPAEKGIPHFYVDINDISDLLKNFTIENLNHMGWSNGSQKFYYVNAKK